MSPNARFSSAEIADVLLRDDPTSAVAKRYGVSFETIRSIRVGISYKHLCPEIPRWSFSGNRKLSPAQVKEIYESDESLGTLARRYSVSRRTIFDIRKNRTYREVIVAPVANTCPACKHWCDRCGFGFPEALEDPKFAADCHLYQPSS